MMMHGPADRIIALLVFKSFSIVVWRQIQFGPSLWAWVICVRFALELPSPYISILWLDRTVVFPLSPINLPTCDHSLTLPCTMLVIFGLLWAPTFSFTCDTSATSALQYFGLANSVAEKCYIPRPPKPNTLSQHFDMLIGGLGYQHTWAEGLSSLNNDSLMHSWLGPLTWYFVSHDRLVWYSLWLTLLLTYDAIPSSYCTWFAVLWLLDVTVILQCHSY